MRTPIFRIAFTMLLALVLASAGMAQRGQRQQRNRQQQRATAMVNSVVESLAAQSDPLVLVFRKDVQHDLQMELGQRFRLDSLHDQQQRDLAQARIQNGRNQGPVNDLIKQQRKKVQSEIDEVLSAQQKKRLRQVSLQIQGKTALFEAGLQKRLGIEQDQADRIQQIRYERDQRIGQLQGRVSAGEVLAVDVPAEIKQIQDAAGRQIGEVLTPEQTDALTKLFGPPFKADASSD